MILRRDAAYAPTAEDYDAIAYLVLEYDCGFDPVRIASKADAAA